MAKKKGDLPVVLSGDKARAGVTGHHVRYVLAFGLAGSIIAFLVMGLYFGYGELTRMLSQLVSYAIIIALAVVGGRASAWTVGDVVGTQSEHQSTGDALAWCCNSSPFASSWLPFTCQPNIRALY